MKTPQEQFTETKELAESYMNDVILKTYGQFVQNSQEFASKHNEMYDASKKASESMTDFYYKTVEYFTKPMEAFMKMAQPAPAAKSTK